MESLVSYRPYYFSLACSDTVDSSSVLESSLSAKEKAISELNMELHKVETTLSNERELHISEIKKLNALLHEKVLVALFLFSSSIYFLMFWKNFSFFAAFFSF